MIGIYFSGTGNTKYCLEKFVALYDRNIEITPLEDTGTMEKVTYHKDIIFALLAPGENRHSGPGENRQFWPDENRQSLFTI